MKRRSVLMLRNRSLAAVLAGLLLVPSAPAWAASPPDAAAVKRFEEGKKAFDAAQFEVALKAFQESLSLLPSPNTRLYIARCYRAMNRPASAYTNYKLAAGEASDRMRGTGEKRYGVTRDQAVSELGEIEAKVPRLTLALPGDAPEGTVVKLDDTEVPKAAWGAAVETDPGPHHVVATAPRRQSFDKSFQLAEGQQQRVEIPLGKIPTGILLFQFASKPAGMEILLDGQPVDPSQWDKLREVDTTQHKVVARAPGYIDFVWNDTVGDGQSAKVEISLAPAPVEARGSRGLPKWIFFSVAGAAVVTLGVATGVAIDAKGKSTDQKALNPLQRDPDVQSNIRSLSTDANILFIAGSALAAGAGALFFVTDWRGHPSDPAEATGMRVAPWMSPSVAGVAAQGSF